MRAAACQPACAYFCCGGNGTGSEGCHGGCGGCCLRCCCCSRCCSLGSMSGRLLLLCAAPASRDGRHSLHRGQVAQVAARVTCEGSQGSNSAVSGLSIRATRMAEAWVADALPGSCAMSLGCFRSEHAPLERARAMEQRTRARAGLRTQRAIARSRAPIMRVAPAATRKRTRLCIGHASLKFSSQVPPPISVPVPTGASFDYCGKSRLFEKVSASFAREQRGDRLRMRTRSEARGTAAWGRAPDVK